MVLTFLRTDDSEVNGFCAAQSIKLSPEVSRRKPIAERKAHKVRMSMTRHSARREFLRSAAIPTAPLTLPQRLFSAAKKSVLVFTKSSGFEHAAVKRSNSELSIAEKVVTDLGKKNGFDVNCTKDGRIFDSKEFHAFGSTF